MEKNLICASVLVFEKQCQICLKKIINSFYFLVVIFPHGYSAGRPLESGRKPTSKYKLRSSINGRFYWRVKSIINATTSGKLQNKRENSFGWRTLYGWILNSVSDMKISETHLNDIVSLPWAGGPSIYSIRAEVWKIEEARRSND